MIRRFILASAMSLGGSVAIASTAMAQSVDINFSGVVQGRCSFNTPTAGTLVTDGPGGSGPQYRLDSSAPGGAPGQVTVICNQPAGLGVSAPIQTAGPSVGGFVEARVESPVGSTGASGGYGGSFPLPPGSTPLTVHMKAESGPNGPLQPGNYGYKVTLTVTP